MNIVEIESIVELVSASNVKEITLRDNGRKLTVKKVTKHAEKLAGKAKGSSLLAPGVQNQGHIGSQKTSALTVNSPMVGIFHHAEPPVGIGTKIEVGKLVGVIESMKLMNDVRSDLSGTVVEIFTEAGMPVEYGSPLFALE